MQQNDSLADGQAARPCWPFPELDCSFRGLTTDLGSKLLGERFGPEAIAELGDAMQLGRYCPALPRTQRPPPMCSYRGAADAVAAAAAPRPLATLSAGLPLNGVWETVPVALT